MFVKVSAFHSLEDSLFDDFVAGQKTVFDNVPKSKEGKPDEETKRTAKVRDQGEEGVDEELLQYNRLDTAVGDHQPELVEVLCGFCADPILEVGARVETSSSLFYLGSVVHCKLDVKILKFFKL